MRSKPQKTHTIQVHVFAFFFFFSAPVLSVLLSVVFGGLATRASFCRACLAKEHVDGEMCRLIRFPSSHLFVQLEASVPGSTPMWRLFFNCLHLHFFFVLQTPMPGHTPVCNVLLG